MEAQEIYLQTKDFCENLQRITTKKSDLDKKQVIVSFGNWGNPRDSIIRGHRRGPVQEVKNKLQKWCEVLDVDEFCTSKLCYYCHCEMAKVKFMEKKSIVFSVAVTTSVELQLIVISMEQGTFLCYWKR
jgi:hypothetical protein